MNFMWFNNVHVDEFNIRVLTYEHVIKEQIDKYLLPMKWITFQVIDYRVL